MDCFTIFLRDVAVGTVIRVMVVTEVDLYSILSIDEIANLEPSGLLAQLESHMKMVLIHSQNFPVSVGARGNFRVSALQYVTR